MSAVTNAPLYLPASMGAAMEKALLSLHAALDLPALWRAIQRVIETALPGSFVGLTMQHNPIRPTIAKWSRAIPDGLFEFKPLQKYLGENPRSRFVRARDVFPRRSALLRSGFYRKYMAPQKCPHATGLFFWLGHRLVSIIVVMRTQEQGELSDFQLKLLRRLYPHFQTALRRLGSLERERSARVAFEEFLKRLPLPTILLRWNMTLVYQNQAAREFCAVWQEGPRIARILKADAPIPREIFAGCHNLKQRWRQDQQLPPLKHPALCKMSIHHPNRPYLRATLSLQQISSFAVARPHFLIEFESLKRATRKARGMRLPHLARLTRREQELSVLLCEGRNNQEIADAAGLSIAMVKKHFHSIFRKLEVTSRSQLMALMR